ncbi:ABC transporter permease [Acidobacteriota bacterium]
MVISSITAKFVRVFQRIILLRHRYGYALLSLVRRDLKTRYSPTFLGLGWAVLQPLILLLIYTFVFSAIIKVRFNAEDRTIDFVLYLVCGFLPYMALSEGILRGSTSLKENRGLLDKVIFPAEVLPAVGVVIAAVTEIIGLLLLVGLAACYGVKLSAWIVFLPLLVLLRIGITLGLAWLTSILNVFITDLGQFLGLLLTAWMFLTPIFYPVDLIPDYLVWLLKVNPLYYVITAYRAVILQAGIPLPELLGLIFWAAAISVLGLWFFRQTISRAKDFL